MKLILQPITRPVFYLYLAGLSLVFISWLNQWLELMIFDNKLQLQLFVAGIIFVAIAAIINLTSHLFSVFQDRNKQNSKNNPSDDH